MLNIERRRIHQDVRNKNHSEASDLARKKYPNGFNKAQLIECAEEIESLKYGKFSPLTLGRSEPSSEEEVHQLGNVMAACGNYPVGMSPCWILGINGNCGSDIALELCGKCNNDH